MAKSAPPQAERLETSRSQTWKHEDLAAYIQEQTGYSADPQTIELAFAMRNEYRKTDRYQNLVEKHREEAKAEKEKAKAERAKAREEAKAKKEAEAKAKGDSEE